MTHPPFAFAEALDRDLGDPNDPGTLFSYRRSSEMDRHEEFPAEACARLDALGVPRYYVPAAFGGGLTDYEYLMMLIRVLARRDFTIALAHGKTYLGSACAWIGSTPEQAKELAAKVLDGDAVSLGLTEAAHGSDLLAGETSAVATASGFRIAGAKWLINNATRGQVICLLARTDPAGGARGHSLLLVDKRDLASGSYRPLPAEPTHGVRGADISGISFSGADVPESALVGELGGGLEILLKGMQVTRILCAALSLGMADHALRLTVDFAAGHRLYNRPLIDLPQAARSLALAYTDLLVAEAVTLVSTRSLQSLPAELGVVSAAVKYWVPTTVDGTIAALSRVLGARALLVDDFADGRFQKVQRDHQIVGIFDGNTHVNLAALVNQFAGLARGYHRRRVDGDGLLAAGTLGTPLPEFDRGRLSLLARGGCSLVQSMPGCVDELRGLAERGVVPASLADRAGEVRTLTDDLHERLAAYRPTAREVPTEAFTLARRYTHSYAAAACMQLWLRNRLVVMDRAPAAAGLWAHGEWLDAALARLLGLLRTPPRTPVRPLLAAADGGPVDRMLRHLRAQHAAGGLFSLLPCQLTGERRGDRDVH